MPEEIKESTENVYSGPEWLTREYLEKISQTYFEDSSLKLLSVDIKPATAKGENYISYMTRVKVQFSREGRGISDASYIVKSTLPNSEFAVQNLRPFEVLEMRMYDKVLPALTALLKEAGDSEDLCAKTIAVDYEKEAIIFEDLSVRSFVIADRLKGFDMDHLTIILRKLAKWHAASAVLNEQSPGCLEGIHNGMFSRQMGVLTPIFLHNLHHCAQAVGKLEGCEQYAKKIANLKDNFVENARRVFDPVDGFFNVLTHGDFWINNVMCSYDHELQPKDALIIDFQFCSWGSPAIDLHLLFNSSLEDDMRLHKQDELIRYYYSVLANTLNALKFKGKIPTLFELRSQIQQTSFHALSISLLMQPVVVNEDCEEAGFESLMGEGEHAETFKKKIYGNKKTLNRLHTLLPIFDNMGLLDPIHS